MADSPLPDNSDTRPPDLLREQADKIAAKDPVAAVPPPSPAMPSVPPPLPSVLDFTPKGAAALQEIARTAVVDTLKNVTINNVPPVISGNNINFEVTAKSSAAQQFAVSNGLSSPLPPPPPHVPHTPPAPQAPIGKDGWFSDRLADASQPSSGSREPAMGGNRISDDGVAITPPVGHSAEESRELGTHKMAGGANHPGTEADPMSGERLKGEMKGQYEARQERVKELKADVGAAAAVANGDTSYFYKGFVPLLVTRGDNKRKILVKLDVSGSGVVEGAVGSEGITTLPPEDAYYMSFPEELGHPWKIYVKNFGTTTPNWRMGIEAHSDVYDGISYSKKSVAGLLVDSTNQFDPGWRGVTQGFAYLEGTVSSDLSITAINIKYGPDLGALERVSSSEGKQTKFTYVLGYVWSSGEGTSVKWLVRQEAFRHVTLLPVSVEGVLCKVPFGM